MCGCMRVCNTSLEPSRQIKTNNEKKSSSFGNVGLLIIEYHFIGLNGASRVEITSVNQNKEHNDRDEPTQAMSEYSMDSSHDGCGSCFSKIHLISKVCFFKEHTCQNRLGQKFVKTAPLIS